MNKFTYIYLHLEKSVSSPHLNILKASLIIVNNNDYDHTIIIERVYDEQSRFLWLVSTEKK